MAQDTKSQCLKSAVSEHNRKENHLMNWEECKILESESNKQRRWISRRVCGYGREKTRRWTRTRGGIHALKGLQHHFAGEGPAPLGGPSSRQRPTTTSLWWEPERGWHFIGQPFSWRWLLTVVETVWGTIKIWSIILKNY